MSVVSSDEEDNLDGVEQAPDRGEMAQSSFPVAQNTPVVEVGQESNSEELLNKYLILHCAKLHLSVTDASSGEYIPRKRARTDENHNSLLKSKGNQAEMMEPILRVNI